jgi:hypothetical protein
MPDLKDFPKHGLNLSPCSPIAISSFPPIGGTSTDTSTPGASGLHCSNGAGVEGSSREGNGIVGHGG